MTDSQPGDPRDALIREQAELLGEQERRLAAQAEQIATLEAMVADLREQLAAAEAGGVAEQRELVDAAVGRMTCRGGSRPGSSGVRRSAAGKKRGSSRGAGASMAWEVPDRTEDHFTRRGLLLRP